MRFMVIVKATKDSEAGVLPTEKLLAEMGKYNEELVESRRDACRRGAATELKRGACPLLGKQAHRGRWTFCRDKRADRGFWLWRVKSLA